MLTQSCHCKSSSYHKRLNRLQMLKDFYRLKKKNGRNVHLKVVKRGSTSFNMTFSVSFTLISLKCLLVSSSQLFIMGSDSRFLAQSIRATCSWVRDDFLSVFCLWDIMCASSFLDGLWVKLEFPRPTYWNLCPNLSSYLSKQKTYL